jgi:DNA-binding MarR family transcriptional regulator
MLRQSLTYQLVSIAEDAIGQGASLFKQRFGLDVHELRVLRLIDDEPGVTFTALAANTKFERSATSRILSRLVKASLVRRRIDAFDARHFQLFATPKGKALRIAADPLSLQLEALVLAPLGAEERRQFLAALAKISDWVKNGFNVEMAKRFPEAHRSPAVKPARRRAVATAKRSPTHPL